MNNIEEGLKRRIGSNYLIGCFTIKKMGEPVSLIFVVERGIWSTYLLWEMT